MACTTILVGKKASYDSSTMIARNDDSGSGHFTAKKFVVVQPEEHPAVYRSVLSHVEIPLPGNALRMTAMPNAVEGKGIWAASGVNAANVGMTATETITSNPLISLSVAPSQRDELVELMQNSKEVLQCYHVTGAYTFLIKVSCGSMPQLEHLILQFQKLGTTSTQIILSTPVNHGDLEAMML